MGESDRRTLRDRLFVPTLAAVVSVGYGALFYGFSVLITRQAAGADFSIGLLSAAYGGAVVTGGITAVPVGRFADRHGIRRILALGGALTFGGMAAFAVAQTGWQVLAVWWLMLGPATAMVFYEPAYVAIQQRYTADARIQAIALLTFLAGLSGPLSIPITGALVDVLGWRWAATVLGASVLVVTAAAAIAVVRPAVRHSEHRPPKIRVSELGLLSSRFVLFSVAGMLAYGSLETIIVHRVARFEEAGFGVGLVAAWAAAAGLISIPGRYLLPSMSRHRQASSVFAGVLAVMGLAMALAVEVSGAWQMAAHFMVFGVVFGAALPLRAVVMGQWYPTAQFGAIMGVQAAAIALARAAFPVGIGVLHDAQRDYATGMGLLTAALLAAAGLVLVSARVGPPVLRRGREVIEARPRQWR